MGRAASVSWAYPVFCEFTFTQVLVLWQWDLFISVIGIPEKERPGTQSTVCCFCPWSGASDAGRHQGAAQTEPRGPEQQPPRPHCPGAPRARRGRGGAARGGWPAARRLGEHARSLEVAGAGRRSARLWAG